VSIVVEASKATSSHEPTRCGPVTDSTGGIDEAGNRTVTHCRGVVATLPTTATITPPRSTSVLAFGTSGQSRLGKNDEEGLIKLTPGMAEPMTITRFVLDDHEHSEPEPRFAAFSNTALQGTLPTDPSKVPLLLELKLTEIL
jgi:hypothetical protein